MVANNGKNYFDYDLTDSDGLREDFRCVKIPRAGVTTRRRGQLQQSELALEQKFYYGYNLDDWSALLAGFFWVMLLLF